MNSLEVLLAVAGFIVTALVVAGMILITPRGQVLVSEDPEYPANAKVSAEEAPRRVAPSVTDLRQPPSMGDRPPVAPS